MNGSVDRLAGLMPRLIATMREDNAARFIKVTLQIQVLYHAGFADLTRRSRAGLVDDVLDEPDTPRTAEVCVRQPRWCAPTHAASRHRRRFATRPEPIMNLNEISGWT